MTRCERCGRNSEVCGNSVTMACFEYAGLRQAVSDRKTKREVTTFDLMNLAYDSYTNGNFGWVKEVKA